MRKIKTLAASAAALLLCFSASQAFAGLQLVSTGTSQSWTMNWVVNQSGGIGNVTAPFNKIVATVIPGSVTYTVSSNSATITNPSDFEDLSNPANGSGHQAWTNFTAGSGFTQTSPVQPLNKFVSTTTATSATLRDPSANPLAFTLNFTGLETMASNADGTNGAHYFIDFFNNTTLVSRYEIKDVINSSGIQVTEITQIPVPLTWPSGPGSRCSPEWASSS